MEIISAAEHFVSFLKFTSHLLIKLLSKSSELKNETMFLATQTSRKHFEHDEIVKTE